MGSSEPPALSERTPTPPPADPAAASVGALGVASGLYSAFVYKGH